ncbi:MAG: hypothetical protein JW924_15290 [Fusobacteriaceae bacterium]|nr:hypothetical protein [Fusobacteriaceae bacterium]
MKEVDKDFIWARLRYWQKGGIVGFFFGLFGFLLFGTTLKSNPGIFYFQELFWWAWGLPYWRILENYCTNAEPCKIFIPFAPAFLYSFAGIIIGSVYGKVKKHMKFEFID